MLRAELLRERESVYNRGKLEGKREGIREGEYKGRLYGKQEGAFEAKKETARKLKARGMPLEEIAEVTGLSVEMIKML